MPITKPMCQTCGRIIPTSGTKLSSIEFRKYVNSINSLDKVLTAKEYLTRFVKNKFRLAKYVESFTRELEENIDLIDPENPDNDIYNFRIWLFNYTDTTEPEPKGAILGNDPESPLYDYLRIEYSSNNRGINETFYSFYECYAQNVDDPLSKNHVSRALTALGLKPIVKKIKQDSGNPKCAIFLSATGDELAKIFKKNGFP